MNQEIKILCVDDEPNVLNAIQRLFLDEEYLLLTALSGEEGLKLLDQEEAVPVVISDYRMPGMNGVDFLKEVHLRRPETIRLVLSGYADIAAIVSAINEGKIYKFIPKPWNDDELRLAVSQAVSIYTLQQEHLALVEQLTRRSADHDLQMHEKTAELAARSSELRMVQGALDAMSCGVLVVDSAKVIRVCNRTCRQLFGIEGDQLLGRPVHGLLPMPVLTAIATIQAEDQPGPLQLHGRQLTVHGRPLPPAPGDEGTAGQWVLEFWERR